MKLKSYKMISSNHTQQPQQIHVINGIHDDIYYCLGAAVYLLKTHDFVEDFDKHTNHVAVQLIKSFSS